MKLKQFPNMGSQTGIIRRLAGAVCVTAAALLVITASSCAGPSQTASRTSPPPASPTRISQVPSRMETAAFSSVTRPTTPTISNSAVLTLISATPQPSRPVAAPPDETGVIPGKSTAADVANRLGSPRAIRGNDWSFGTPLVSNVVAVKFSEGIVQEMTLEVPADATAEGVLAQHGPPELVAFFPQPERPASAVPVTPPPLGPPSGELVYLSRGVLFHFVCNEAGLRTCPGVSRKVPIYYKVYFIPMAMEDWVSRQPRPPDSFYIRPWSGFTD